MSQENVDQYRAWAEDFIACQSDANWQGWIVRASEGWDPAIDWDATELQLPDIGRYRGIEAAQQFWRDWLSAWETLVFDYELLDAGDKVVMLLEQRMRGRSSGVEVSLGKYAHVATFRGGLMVHWKAYMSRSEALKAVRLEE